MVPANLIHLTHLTTMIWWLLRVKIWWKLFPMRYVWVYYHGNSCSNDIFLQRPAILNLDKEENPIESLFDNDDDIQIEAGQESDNGLATSQHSSVSNHHSVPPTTDSDHDITMHDDEDNEPEVDHRGNKHRKKSVCDNHSVNEFWSSQSQLFSSFSLTSEGISCRGRYHVISPPFSCVVTIHFQ